MSILKHQNLSDITIKMRAILARLANFLAKGAFSFFPLSTLNIARNFSRQTVCSLVWTKISQHVSRVLTIFLSVFFRPMPT